MMVILIKVRIIVLFTQDIIAQLFFSVGSFDILDTKSPLCFRRVMLHMRTGCGWRVRSSAFWGLLSSYCWR